MSASPIDALIEIPDPSTGGTRTTTVGDRVAEFVRNGLYFELACKAAGVSRTTGYEWRKVAGQLRIRAYGRTLDEVHASPHERRCLAFADLVERAEAEAAAVVNALIQRQMRGGFDRTRRTTTVRYETTYDARGRARRREVDRTEVEVTDTAEPDGAMLRWWMERRFTEYYGRHDHLTVDTPTLTDEERAESLVTAMEEWLAEEGSTAAPLPISSTIRPRDGSPAAPTARAALQPPADATDPPPSPPPVKRQRDARGHVIGVTVDHDPT